MIGSITWKGQKALKFANSSSELVVPTGFGPRIMSGRRKGGENLFLEIPEAKGGVSDFRLRGGHRLWHAPEHGVRTYQPDNAAPKVVRHKGREAVSFVCETESKTGIQKAVTIEVLRDAFRITHTLTNHGLWPVELAPWALTMFRAGGIGVVPLLPKGDHSKGDFLPNYSIIPWSYTDLSLPCWKFNPSFIGIDVAKAPHAQKLGISNYPGWSAYWLEGDLFVKYSPVMPGSGYPDLGSAFETFTNGQMIELETLGSLVRLEPGSSVDHVEEWTILSGIQKPDTEKAYVEHLAPRVQAWLEQRGHSD